MATVKTQHIREERWREYSRMMVLQQVNRLETKRNGTCHPLHLNRNAQVQVWLALLPIHSCVGDIANRGQWEQSVVYSWLQTWVQLGPHVGKKSI